MIATLLLILAVSVLAWPTWRLASLLAGLARQPPLPAEPSRFSQELLQLLPSSPPVAVVQGGGGDRLAFGGQIMVVGRAPGTAALRAVQLALACVQAGMHRRHPLLVRAVDAWRTLGLSCQIAGLALLVTAVARRWPADDLAILGLGLALATAASLGVWAWDRQWAKRVASAAARLGHAEVGSWAGALADARVPGLAWYVAQGVLLARTAQRMPAG